ncbi:MAG: ABC transporter permease [Actinomycetota bacterium]|nr:ABC transporter permease [Actinomycetota bacterium]
MAPLVRVNAPQPFLRGFCPAVREIWAYRELLGSLVTKELKVKYKNSFLGFLWSLLRPLCLLMIYWLVLGKFLRSNIPDYAFYLFAGLVAWDLFGSTVTAATGSIVNNAGLIKKVYFPREILPLATVGAGLVHFALQLLVMFGVLLAFQYDFFGANLLLVVLAIIPLVAFLTAISLLVAAANVFLRDVQHLVEVLMLFWFWLTPIVYPIAFAFDVFKERAILGVKLSTIYLLNPMANIVLAFQRGIYKRLSAPDDNGNLVKVLYQASVGTYLGRLVAVTLFSLVLVWFAQRMFARVQGNFAQEL